jgi:hypothetical protein
VSEGLRGGRHSPQRHAKQVIFQERRDNAKLVLPCRNRDPHVDLAPARSAWRLARSIAASELSMPVVDSPSTRSGSRDGPDPFRGRTSRRNAPTATSCWPTGCGSRDSDDIRPSADDPAYRTSMVVDGQTVLPIGAYFFQFTALRHHLTFRPRPDCARCRFPRSRSRRHRHAASRRGACAHGQHPKACRSAGDRPARA